MVRGKKIMVDWCRTVVNGTFLELVYDCGVYDGTEPLWVDLDRDVIMEDRKRYIGVILHYPAGVVDYVIAREEGSVFREIMRDGVVG